MRSGLHNIGEGFVSGKSATLQTIEHGFVRAVDIGGIGGNDANTLLLLHCDGSDASTTFTDSSASARTVTPAGNAQIDTAQSKFGGASGLLDGTGDYLTVPSHADFAHGTGNWTRDWWIRFNTIVTLDAALGVKNSYTFQVAATGRLAMYHVVNGYASEKVATSASFSTATWYHLALEKHGSNLNLFVDGTRVAQNTENLSFIQEEQVIGSRDILGLGKDKFFDGWIDEFRISNIARYEGANFTPPAAPYS